MFENLSLLALQQYWWFLVSVLGSALVFLLFVQGGQMLIYQMGKTENERTMIVNSLGRKWEFTFTTLVTFGGAFFASFPLFYSTSFGGAYWVWMAILFAFVLQAVSYEFRSKPNNFLGKKTFEVFLFINGALGTILLGTAVGTFFNGAAFTVEKANLTNMSMSPIISSWTTAAHGLEAVLDIHNVLLGLTVFFLARLLGTMYLLSTIDNEELVARLQKNVLREAIPFVVVFLAFTIILLFSEGYAYNPETLVVSIEPMKYLHNLLAMPIVLVLLLLGVVSVLWGIFITAFKESRKGLWFSGLGAFVVVLMLFMLAGLNNTCFYPSNADLQSSLHIQNASSSKYTLVAMSYVSLLVPFVLAYIVYAWASINKKKITEEEMQEESHVY